MPRFAPSVGRTIENDAPASIAAAQVANIVVWIDGKSQKTEDSSVNFNPSAISNACESIIALYISTRRILACVPCV